MLEWNTMVNREVIFFRLVSVVIMVTRQWANWVSVFYSALTRLWSNPGVLDGQVKEDESREGCWGNVVCEWECSKEWGRVHCVCDRYMHTGLYFISVLSKQVVFFSIYLMLVVFDINLSTTGFSLSSSWEGNDAPSVNVPHILPSNSQRQRPSPESAGKSTHASILLFF